MASTLAFLQHLRFQQRHVTFKRILSISLFIRSFIKGGLIFEKVETQFCGLATNKKPSSVSALDGFLVGCKVAIRLY